MPARDLGSFPGGNGGGPEARVLIETRLRIVRILHFGFLMTLVFYAILVQLLPMVLGSFSGLGGTAPIRPIRGLLYGGGALAVGAVLVLKPRLLSVQGLGRPTGEPDLVRDLRLLHTRQIALTAMAELAATSGLLLFLLSGVPADFYLLAALSLLGLLALTPRRDLWESLARRYPS